jgi:hypothetical protein
MDFADYINSITDERRSLSARDLSRLSDLSAEEAATLAKLWHGIGARRRQELVEALTALAEDNIECDFDKVFLIALDDADASTRKAALDGLWENESPAFIGRLTAFLRGDPNAGVRSAAALALGRFVLLYEYGRLRDRHYDEVESALRSSIDDSRETAEVRGRAVEAMGARDAEWVREAIEDAYESGVHRLKVSALHAMGRSCESHWLPTLIRELLNDEAEVRYEAAIACGSIGDELAVPYLVPLLTDEDAEVRAAAMGALGEIGGSAARDALLAMMDSASDAEREAAEAALSEIDFEDDPLGVRSRR